MLTNIRKLLVANRGEIAIRVLRAASELHITTVAIFTYEDRYSLHRYKADEAYQIGVESEPLKPYLDIEEIIALAKAKKVDAIHPGYGFLSENVQLARRCEQEGIIFVGPRSEVMEQLGDKVAAKNIARQAGVPMIEDSKGRLLSTDVALSEAQRVGFPVMLKAASGGGGRGMRVVRTPEDLIKLFPEARNEALKAFGDDTIFIEKFIEEPKHLEVQIMGDAHGNLVHLYERDCSVQRRFQKVVEIAPSIGLKDETRHKLYEYALRIAKAVNYNNVGTVEFLLDKDQNVFFIEVNPRIQVEHTITEEITGIDIVRSQILIADGRELSDKQIYIRSQDDVVCNGFAIQCRITTEDPINGFKPDYGTIVAYRSASGFGIRLDEGSAYAGMKISPFFDSLLVKVSAKGRTLWGTADRLHRALREFRIRGVKTNIGFLINVISNEEFRQGKATVNFIAKNPDLMNIPVRLDRGTKVLRYLADVVVNGHPEVRVPNTKKFRVPKVPDYPKLTPLPEGSRDKLKTLGRDKFVQWLKNEKAIHYTDTTFRDAHQSLLATRMRTLDMTKVAESYAHHFPQMFSVELWGGATFDVAMRFLHECPWERLRRLRRAMPNVLFQMLLRGANAVGYKSYPNNLVEKFIEKSAENGVDVFRIFDSLNWVEAMKTSIKAVLERTNALAEGAICYTGEIMNPSSKYSLRYYVDLAKKLEDLGIHILAIKDMAGLLKPYSAELLVSELKKHISVPIHLHTHDTAGIQSATLIKAIDAGVDVVDLAVASMSGLTSQPNLNSFLAAMQYHERQNPLNLQKMNEFSVYWEDVREYYHPFESDLKSGTAQVYDNEIPGGQYSNLRPQAISLGLEHQFEQIKKNYAVANQLVGDIVKVTPSSKVVGDLAMFMTANNLTENDIWERGLTLSFPESVKELLRGDIGQPEGGFPEKLIEIVLKGEKPYTGVPGAELPPVNFDQEFAVFQQNFKAEGYVNAYPFEDFLSYKMYPKVFEEFQQTRNAYGDLSVLPTPTFFYGLKPGEEVFMELGSGKSLMIKLLAIFERDDNGMVTVSFELNGQTRRVSVKDKKFTSTKIANRKAKNDGEIGSPLQGKLSSVLVKAGENVAINTPLFVIEAMKMESTVTANRAGTIKELVLLKGAMVEQDDLVVVLG